LEIVLKKALPYRLKIGLRKNLAKKNKFKTIFLDKNKEGGRC